MQKASQPSCILKKALVFDWVWVFKAPPEKLPNPAFILPSVRLSIWLIISLLEPFVTTISAPLHFKSTPFSSVKQPVTTIFNSGYSFLSFVI